MKAAPARVRSRVVFNGRPLAGPRSRFSRYAIETLRSVDALLDQIPSSRRNASFELAVPDDCTVPSFAALHVTHVPGRGGLWWEQWALPRHARGAFLVNFSDSGPWLLREQLVTLHDAAARATPAQFSSSDRWSQYARMSWLGARARSVMTASNFSRDELEVHFGLARADIVVGVQGGEHACVPADDTAVVHRHRLTQKGYVLCVGPDTANQNFMVVARAMSLLPTCAWSIAIAGTANASISCEPGASPNGLRFLGSVPDDELAALYRQAACFVLPSLYEGFGLPALEAMANDCPVVAAHAAALPEVCGDAALYFDPHDPGSLAEQLSRVGTEPALRDELVAAGRAQLRHYSWSNNARILLDHLDALGLTG